MKAPEAWERQPGESSRAWEARRMYIHMGPTRSIERVSQELTKSIPLLKRWSSRWKWVLTAIQYDSYNDEIASREVVERRGSKLKAEAEKWDDLDDKYPTMLMDVFILAYNDLIEAEKQAKAAKRPVPYRQRAAMILNIARAAPLADLALELVKNRQQKANAGPDGKAAGYVPGRTLAVLKAFNEFRATVDEDAG